MTRRALILTSALPLVLSPALAAADTGYHITVTQSTSSLSYSFNASAPFGASTPTGMPTIYSTLVGADDTTLPAAEQTRTHLGLSCTGIAATVNDPVHISGSITASGSGSGSSAPHPSGTFSLGLNTTTGVCRLQDLNLNLVASGSISSSASLSQFTYQSFCAVNPSCTAFYLFPVTLPLGTVDLTSLLAQQAPGVPDSGTLTPVAGMPGQYNFSVTTTVTVTPTVSFSGAPIAATPQDLPITLAGTVTIAGNTATIAASTQLMYAPPAAAPGLQAPTPFTIPAGSPLCSGINIVLTMNILSTTITNNTTATINAAGPRFTCKCDINNDGVVTVQDIFDFLSYWFASNPIADFNGTGGISTQDIFDFLSCWFTPPVGC
jgi:hypothetical protein